RERGHIYGPLRLTRTFDSPKLSALIESVTQPGFICDKTAVIMVRDPRDFLVSSYYSFGFSHQLSPVEEISATQQKFRNEIQSMSIDDYVLNHYDQIEDGYNRVAALRKACRKCIVLRYEDMIDDWQTFSDGLTK